MHSLRVRVGAGRLQPLAWPSVPAGRQSQLRGQRACRPCGGASRNCGAVCRGTAPGDSRLGTSLCGPLPEASRFYLGIPAGPQQEQPKWNFWEEILSFKPEFQGNVSPLWASGDPRARCDSYPGTCARQRPGPSALVVGPGTWGRLELGAQLQVVGVLDPAQGPCHLFVRRAALLAAASALQLLRAALPLPSLPFSSLLPQELWEPNLYELGAPDAVS